jgi:hypothetical protein
MLSNLLNVRRYSVGKLRYGLKILLCVLFLFFLLLMLLLLKHLCT